MKACIKEYKEVQRSTKDYIGRTDSESCDGEKTVMVQQGGKCTKEYKGRTYGNSLVMARRDQSPQMMQKSIEKY